MTPERYLTAKELSMHLEYLGASRHSYKFALEVVRVCPQSLGREVRLSDAIAFLRENREWRPFSKTASIATNRKSVEITAL
jgi:hypothetical protein